MGVVVLIVSLIALFTVAGGPDKIGLRAPVDTSRFIVSRPIVEPPARKSIIVDTDGYAYRTADGTQMTKRDRTKFKPKTPRTFEYKLPETPAPVVAAPATETPVVVEPSPTLDVVTQPETKTVEDMSVPMMPAEGLAVTETVTEPTGEAVQLTENQKIASSILESDPALSEWARTTLRCSFREGLLILYGVAKDENEKQHIADLAKGLSQVQSIENQLQTLETTSTPQPIL